MKMAQVSPSKASQKYSNEENPKATSASNGALTISTNVPNSPPKAETAHWHRAQLLPGPCGSMA